MLERLVQLWEKAFELHALVALTAGHCLLFVPGIGWLSTFIGLEAAWTKGVLPFVAGTIVKTLLAFTVLLAVRRVGSQLITTSGETVTSNRRRAN